MNDRIDLAHGAPFPLGTLLIRPSTREIVSASGSTEIVEPRVMQVLVALARAKGEVVSRDDLTHSCWDGRVIGEDAINRVISRLRRLAETSGGGFRVETVTKVGYRLVLDGSAEQPPGGFARPTGSPRRAVLAGAAALGIAAPLGALWWRGGLALAPHPLVAAVPTDVAPLMQQAAMVIRQGDTQGLSQAIGLYKRVVALRPDFADGWGALAAAYSGAAHGPPGDAASMEARTRAAAQRAFALDPGNALARIALVGLLPYRDNWLKQEQAARQAIADHPENQFFLATLSGVLSAVGRMRDAATLTEQAVGMAPPLPGLLYRRVLMLWAANRLEEADRAIGEAYALFPIHVGIWFTRFYMMMFGGRPRDAIAFAEDVDHRPPGIPDDNFDIQIAVARALDSGKAADIDTAMRLNLAASRRGAGYAGNTIKFASALGRLDDGFAVADAFFFGRGFDVSDVEFTREQGGYSRRADRPTIILFLPPCAALRADPRFERLVTEIGLTKYWSQSRSQPDYKRM